MFSLLNSTQIYGLQAATATATAAPQEHNKSTEIDISTKAKSNSLPPLQPNPKHNTTRHKRSASSLSAADTNGNGNVNRFFVSLSSMQGMKSPTNFIEKFIKNDLLSGYDTFKNNYKHHHTNHTAIVNANNRNSSSSTSNNNNNNNSSSNRSSSGGNGGNRQSIYNCQQTESLLNGFNCLQGSYRSSFDGEFYEVVNVKQTTASTPTTAKTTATEATIATTSPAEAVQRAKSGEAMTIRCSKNLLADSPQAQCPAMLQNYQKLPEYAQDMLLPAHTAGNSESASGSGASGASSGEFNTDSAGHTPASNLYKKLNLGARLTKHAGVSGGVAANGQTMPGNELNSDNSSSSVSSYKSSEVQRSSSGSSTSQEGSSNSTGVGNGGVSGTCKKTVEFCPTVVAAHSPERIQRRKLLQMISAYEQQSRQMQRELAREKRRRTEELACVVKSLICFESKLKIDMKAVNQRMAEKDVEICRLVRHNRALRKQLANQMVLQDDEGVVVGERYLNDKNENGQEEVSGVGDCLVLEALQCNNCRKQFYDIELTEACTQTNVGVATAVGKDGSRCTDRMEHGSSSDDTVSSSFYGARRSVRYTSKRTSGTFRDYMRSRAMNIDDPALEQGSEENTSTISREDSQTSYEQLHNYSRTIERMHGVNLESSEQSSLELMQQHQHQQRCVSQLSNKSSSSHNSSKLSHKSIPTPAQLEEDDGIFSPTQDDEDFDDNEDGDDDDETELLTCGAIKIVQRRSTEFSEASPKQIYETSTDDWYASASDQEEALGATPGAAKSYGHGAVNPVLECVNQILLQQSMEEIVPESPKSLLESAKSATVATGRSAALLDNNAHLPRRSSLSGRRSAMAATQTSSSQRATTLTRKRVHFSTKNSMVHVPRNNDDSMQEVDEEEAEQHVSEVSVPGIATNQLISQHYHTMNAVATRLANPTEALNYESIYSNEYEPIGSERTSNLYVDMDAASIKAAPQSADANENANFGKLPPALPPKPANLIKFTKSLQKLEELPDEQDCAASTTTTAGTTEPDYCSISELNVGVTSVQIVADIHKAPPSESAPPTEPDLEVSTFASDDTFSASQKTDEIEEIFADIPKLPNVAAIIAPKQAKYQKPSQQQNDYLIMTPSQTVSAIASADATPHRKLASADPTQLKLQLAVTTLSMSSAASAMATTPTGQSHQSHYKRKHVPNILAEINKRMSLPSTPTTPTSSSSAAQTFTLPTQNKSAAKSNPFAKLEECAVNLPLQAEFDWYNLDAEYGKTTLQPELLKVSDSNGMLAEIQEDNECGLVAAADEYNLDEEFNMAAEEEAQQATLSLELAVETAANMPIAAPPAAKAKKIKNNLANFEKFIEGSGLSTKPLPCKRKIYFSGPFV